MSFGKLGIPAGQMRLAYAIMLTVPIGIFMYLATVTQGWLTLTRFIYVVFGVFAGAAMAIVETRIVLSRLSQSTETIVWQMYPIGSALLGVPLLLVFAAFGSSEYAPFGLFGFFPLMISLFGVSGWLYSKFDRENGVNVYVFVYGFKYWVQPNPDRDSRFYYFIRAVAEKDSSQFWAHIGYVGTYSRSLAKNQEISDPQTREVITQILKTMKKYRVIVLSHFAVTMILSVAIFIVIFSFTTGRIQFSYDILDIVIPAGAALWFSLGINVFASMRMFNKRIARLLATVDSTKLSSA